jgi:transposase
MPQSPTEWLPENHLAFFILDVLDQLDLTAIERKVQSTDPRGERPYSPRMMTALLLYGYTVGVFSSRKIEQATHGDVAFRMLAAGEHPHFTTVNSFRDSHREALAGLFGQVLAICMSAGLVKLAHVAIDGTKMKANASKHKAMSAERMEHKEQQLTDEIEALLAKAEEVDAAEDAEYGAGNPEPGLRAEWSRRDSRREKIREHLAALKQEAAQGRASELRAQAQALRATSASADPAVTPKTKATARTLAKKRDAQADLLDPVEHDKDDNDPPPPAVDADLPRNKPPTTKAGKPKPHAQRNFTDPESRIMFRDGAYMQAYNAQLAVDDSHQIIVAAALSNQAPDAEYLQPMLNRVVENCGRVPEKATADAGYFSSENVHYAEHLGVEPFIAVNRHRRDGKPGDEAQQLDSYATIERAEMRALLDTERGRAAYARRKATVEPVFGQIKSARGFRQLSFRGLLKNRLEWLFVAATHNLRKLWRYAPQEALAA